MGHHNHQAVVGDFGEQVHDLHARFGVERAGRLVGQDDFRFVYQSARDGDALHLSAGKLAGLFIDMLVQPNAFKRVGRALPSFGSRYARKGKRQLNIFEDCLVGNEVICLENETDSIVAIGIPIVIFVFLG